MEGPIIDSIQSSLLHKMNSVLLAPLFCIVTQNLLTPGSISVEDDVISVISRFLAIGGAIAIATLLVVGLPASSIPVTLIS